MTTKKKIVTTVALAGAVVGIGYLRNEIKGWDARDAKITIDLGNDNLPTSRLREIAKIDFDEYLVKIINHPNTTVDMLTDFSKSDMGSVRAAVASNIRTSEQTLYDLSNDKWWGVKLQVALNPNSPFEALENISKSVAIEPDVRDMNENDIGLLNAVIRNPKTSKVTLKDIVNSSNLDFSRQAKAQLEFREHDAKPCK